MPVTWDWKGVNKDSGITEQELRVRETLLCVDDEQEESPFLTHVVVFFFISSGPKIIKDAVSSISFVVVGCNFVLTKNDVIFIMFLQWPCEISSMFLALCEGRVEWNSNSTLFEGFVHVDWGTGTVKECCGDSWLLWLERTEDCLGDNLASVLRRMLRKRNSENALESWASNSLHMLD